MKPSIGREVFCVYDDSCILIEKVFAVGDDCFIISSFSPYTRSDSWVWWYDDYNETWFTNLEKAKKKLLKILKKDYPNSKFRFVEDEKSIEVIEEVKNET
jgi:hypothetical protein